MHYTVGQGGQMSCSGVEGVPEGSGYLQRPWRAEGVRFPKGRGLMVDNSLPLTLNVSVLPGVYPPPPGTSSSSAPGRSPQLGSTEVVGAATPSHHLLPGLCVQGTGLRDSALCRLRAAG